MTAGEAGAAARTMIVPLALARFVASYPATKMVITLIGLVLGRAHPPPARGGHRASQLCEGRAGMSTNPGTAHRG
jgi:hypothetical protein